MPNHSSTDMTIMARRKPTHVYVIYVMYMLCIWVHTFRTTVEIVEIDVPCHFGGSLLPSTPCLQTAVLPGRENNLDAHTGGVR